MVPSFLLYDRTELRALLRKCRVHRRKKDEMPKIYSREKKLISLISFVLFLPSFGYHSTRSRIFGSLDQIQNLRGALHIYEGTQSFHNFTNGKTADDASSTRCIISFTTQDPVRSRIFGAPFISMKGPSHFTTIYQWQDGRRCEFDTI
jgi:tRNA U38,U39,U40 pseudouridine synthase TruA